ncbi:MAG: hypothetical protein GF320_08715 [Armatimonadia bacterium]|nr:hypothetical protein [Armatimonadia bacterium]
MTQANPASSSVHTTMHIHSAEDLLKALRIPDQAVITSVLRAVAADPDGALRFGRHEGRDVVDELMALYRETPASSTRAAFGHTLMAFDDPRVLDFVCEEFTGATHGPVILAMAARLAELPVDERREVLEPVLLDPQRPTHVRAAANLLADCIDLAPSQALRVALVADARLEPPQLTEATAEAWLRELAGPYPDRAKSALASQGPRAAAELLRQWEHLGGDLRRWALQWACQCGAEGAVDRVRALVRDARDEATLRVALECARTMPRDVVEERELQRLYQHDSADIRAAALGAGTDELDWRARMDAEPEGHVRRAILGRLERSLSERHVELLAHALHDPDWRVRSAAGRMLVSLGDMALGPLRGVFLDDDEDARAAAGRALMELGEQQWIEANLPD